MTPKEIQEFIKNSTLEELCDSVIWTELMEATAHTGISDRFRESLVARTQEAVRWAIAQKKQFKGFEE